MDIDETTAAPANDASTVSSKKPNPYSQVELKPDDPFDLDAYVAPYTDRRRIDRLLFVARSCPTIRAKAYQLALDAIKQYSLDYKLYLDVANECKDLGIEADEVWAEDARVKQENGMEKLDVELKNYQNNLIKESIRMGFRDIGHFQRKSGDLAGAVRSYTKSKDYCTTSQHVFDMSLSIVDTALDQCSYGTVRNYALKADSALNHISGPPAKAGADAKGVPMPGMVATYKREEESRSKHLQLMGEKLSVATAVAHLGQLEYGRAANALLNLSAPQPPSLSSSSSRDNAATNTSHFISLGDIGLYAVLCGMASLNRDSFKRMVLDNANLRPYLEHTSFLKDLILKYYNSKFLDALQLLEQHMSRLRLDIHLHKHVNNLLARIKDRMVQLYFEPFKAVKVDKMASAFGWESKELELEVVKLIQRGSMKARIDTRDRIIQSEAIDERDTLYQHALKTAETNDKASRAMAFRIKLIQNDLVVDAKKDSTQANYHQQQQGSKSGKGGNRKEKEKVTEGGAATEAIEVAE